MPRLIGSRWVSDIALGGAGSRAFSSPPMEDLGIKTIHAALDAGIAVFDTARAYTNVDHPGQDEVILARALAEHSAGSDAFVVTKGGHYRDGDLFVVDLRRDTIRAHCELSLELLGMDCLDLYLLHWPSYGAAAALLGVRAAPPVHGDIPLTEVMAAYAELQDEGLLRAVGVSNVTMTELEEARSVASIVAVENRFGPFVQHDRALVDYCAARSIAYLAYSPLRPTQTGPFAGKSLAESFPGAAQVADQKAISMQRLALAWMLQLSPTLIPISGSGRPETAVDSAGAMAVNLTQDDLELLDFE